MVTAEAVEQIVQAITPYVGQNMAQSAARAHCLKLGIGEADITPAQISQLIAKFETGLCVFIGREKASAVMTPLRVQLGGA